MQDTVKNIDYALYVLKILKDNTSLEKPMSKKELLDKLVAADTSSAEEDKVNYDAEGKKDKFRDKKRDKHRKVLNRLLNTFIGSRQDDGKHNLPEIKQDKKGKWYYEQAISKEMAEYLIEALQFSQTIEPEQVEKLIKKVKQLAGETKSESDKVVKYSNLKRIMREKVHTNIAIIQTAISHNAKISFVFQKYVYNKNAKKPAEKVDYEYRLELVPKREQRYTVSPYYIAAYNSRYYLIANTDSFKKGEVYNNLSIYRLDLMEDIKIEEIKVMTPMGKKVSEFVPRRKQKEIQELSGILKVEDLIQRHLNMYYDDPVPITILIHRDRYFSLINAGMERIKVMEENYKGTAYDKVRLESVSPEAVIQWAIQYSDYVKILSPDSVCDKMRKKIESLSEKYLPEEEK